MQIHLFTKTSRSESKYTNINRCKCFNLQNNYNTITLTSRTCCSTVLSSVAARPPTKVRYCIISFVVSVFPAPLSPLTNIDWLRASFIMALDYGDKWKLIKAFCELTLHIRFHQLTPLKILINAAPV